MNPKQHKTLVIAHRGASGYVPEHTLVAKGLAHAMGADYLEQDVVASRDHQPVVLHDIHLDTVTDVAKKFPTRRRTDGRYYVIDFDLAELKQLDVVERFDRKTGRNVFANRYHGGGSGFKICTLDEEIEFIKNLNRTLGRQAGIYPEIKQPAWHREQGCDLTQIVLDRLANSGYKSKSDPCFLQCFDEFEVKRIRNQLGFQGNLIQLIGSGHDERSGTDFNRLKTREGLADLVGIVDGVGPALDAVIGWNDNGQPQLTELIRDTHQVGLMIHPWTVRADQLPQGCPSLPVLVRALLDAGVDGVFTDHADQVIALRDGDRAVSKP